MTHVGPHCSSTTIDRNNRLYYSGSKTLDAYLNTNSKNIVVWVHGHTHEGKGLCMIERVPIINPGPMTAGCFSIMTLKNMAGRWQLFDIRFIDLNMCSWCTYPFKQLVSYPSTLSKYTYQSELSLLTLQKVIVVGLSAHTVPPDCPLK